MSGISYEQLTAACRPGGASALTSRTELRPAAGPLAGVAPARYVRGTQGTYAFETRYDGASEVSVVIIDGKASQLNRIESQLAQAIRDEHQLLTRTPRINLTYEGRDVMTDLDLSHRFADGHIRGGTIDGEPATSDPTYRAIRDATHANARAVLEASPISLIGGAWDSTRASNQARYRSIVVGEIIGILADQSDEGRQPPARGAARSDSISPSVKLSGDDMEKILAAQEEELSPKNVESIRRAIKQAGAKGRVSGSKLGLGSIPPSMEGLGLVSCSRIVRHHVLSFAALRQLRFGLGVDGDVVSRALLAALALNGLARSDDELLLRANCDLVEAEPTEVSLDGRQGRTESLDALTIDEADELLGQAIERAVDVGIRWEGQTLDVVGNPVIRGGMNADEPQAED